MPDEDVLESHHREVVAAQQPVDYPEAVYMLLERIRAIWTLPALKQDEGVEQNTNTVTPFESFIGVSFGSIAIEPLVRSEIDRRDTDGSLGRWLADIPARLFDQVAYEMGCIEIDQAKTREEAVGRFLRHFGYVEETDRDPPEGIFAAHEIIEETKHMLSGCGPNDINLTIGHGTRIARAIESALQILVLFYGQFTIPNAFEDYLRQKRGLRQGSGKLAEWWKTVKSKIAPETIRSDIHSFLIQHQTQMELSIRILKDLNEYVRSKPEFATRFYSIFERNTIFPAFDRGKLAAHIGQYDFGDFLDQLYEIKRLRNAIDHADRILQEGKVKPKPSEIYEKVKQLGEVSSYFIEAGKSHRLFPEVILVIGISQNIRRRWRVNAIDEKNNIISFPTSREKLDIFVPDCEILCWPQERLLSGPRVALIKLWRE